MNGLLENVQAQWFVMRDLKRPNAKEPAYLVLQEKGIEVFTPMKWHLRMKLGKRICEQVPFMQDLLFVHEARERLDLIVEQIPTLQYRYLRGKGYRIPMTVREPEMQRFILAVNSADTPCYYQSGEITPDMYGRKVHIVGGALDGYEGRLLSSRGASKKRLIVELPGLLSVAVEVSPEYIRFV